MPPRVDNLRESTHRAIRLVALGHLADASAARDRFADPSDHDALHQFRVALRRLRTWERAFRPYLRDDLTRKLRRRLRNLARDTNASRDLEVHRAWLIEQRRSLGRRQRPGLGWLLANIDRRKAEADAALAHDIEARFARLESRFHRALASYREKVWLRDDGRGVPLPPFADALAPRVRDAARVLRSHLERVHSASDERDGHAARIAAKRTRYLLEPVTKSVRGASDVVERLKSLQDVLGDLHDAQVFGAEIAQLAAEAAKAGDAPEAVRAEDAATPNVAESRTDSASASGETNEPIATETVLVAPAAVTETTANRPELPPDGIAVSAAPAPVPSPAPDAPVASPAGRVRATAASPAAPDPMPGIAAIAERLRERATAAFAQFSIEWLGDKSAAFFRDLDAVADEIARAARAGMEIERKYLLTSLPDEARDGRRLDIDQGYIPGTELHERIRRVSIRHHGGRREVHYFRTVKLGEDVARIEVEEETTEAIFEVLWPLTRGRRLRKCRFEVEANGRTWEIDAFRNRHLVLAEIELGSEDDEVSFPEWLAPVVQREVTGEPEFQNINLAR